MNNEPYNIRFGLWLQSQIQAKGCTLRQLASGTNLSENTLSRLVRGLRTPTEDIKAQIEHYFNVAFGTTDPTLESNRGPSADSVPDILGETAYVFCCRGHMMPEDADRCRCGSNEMSN